MAKLHQLFVKPFAAKGLIWGTIDIAVKILAIIVWAYMAYIALSLVWQSLALDYDPFKRLWWFAYSFLMLFGTSLIAYILVFVRDYNEEPTEE